MILIKQRIGVLTCAKEQFLVEKLNKEILYIENIPFILSIYQQSKKNSQYSKWMIDHEPRVLCLQVHQENQFLLAKNWNHFLSQKDQKTNQRKWPSTLKCGGAFILLMKMLLKLLYKSKWLDFVRTKQKEKYIWKRSFKTGRMLYMHCRSSQGYHYYVNREKLASKYEKLLMIFNRFRFCIIWVLNNLFMMIIIINE